MKNKYFNDAVIGNNDMKASYTKKGELLRLNYPNINFRQFIDEFMVGIKVNDSALIKLHDDVNNNYTQYYTEDTNILNTEIKNTYFNIKVIQTDYVTIKENILVKKYKFVNENSIDLDVNLLIYSKLISSQNNSVSGIYVNDALVHYMHDYSMCILSKQKPLNYQINNSKATINSGKIGGKDYVGMSPDSSISYDIGHIKPGETKEIEILITVFDNNVKSHIKKIEDEISRIKKIDFNKEFENTKKYWVNYVKKHDTLELKSPNNKMQNKIEKIYKRTILLFPLLVNNQTGGIAASYEVDENRNECGGYAFCWPRDSIFITKAMNKLEMKKEIEKYYKTFCNISQSKDGMWEQRFYTDGAIAPSWGYQIDETASVIYGIYEYYNSEKDIKFLKDNFKMCEKAIEFLEKYIDDILQNKHEMKLSYDIWEECEDIHAYSIGAIFAAFDKMLKIYDAMLPQYENNRLKIEQINKEKQKLLKYLLEIKQYILNNFYDKNKKYFIRNKTDKKMDISLLGLVTPFEIFSPKEKKIQNTVERINLTIRTFTGGYKRYEGDTYMKGNPWVIANLWLAEYYIKLGSKTKARECFNYVVNSSTELGFLPEQVNNETMEPAWVIGLGWSHAMFINVLEKLI